MTSGAERARCRAVEEPAIGEFLDVGRMHVVTLDGGLDLGKLHGARRWGSLRKCVGVEEGGKVGLDVVPECGQCRRLEEDGFV